MAWVIRFSNPKIATNPGVILGNLNGKSRRKYGTNPDFGVKSEIEYVLYFEPKRFTAFKLAPVSHWAIDYQ